MSGDKFDKANSLIAKLKAHGTESDSCNLKEVYESYKSILTELPAKDRGSFSLNVLCILCRNIEKVPIWREKICKTQLLELSVCCVRQTRPLDKTDQVKILACVYHIHRYLVRQDTILQAALLLKLSYMPFEVTEELLQRDHYKVYWSILADRIFYIEKLKSSRNINDLLKKLNEDIKMLIKIYNPVQFCSNILTFVIKKLHFLYSDVKTEELMAVYRNIFDCITTKDNIKLFKSITNEEAIDIYIKLNDCLYVIIDNDSKVNFKGSDLEFLVRKIISLLIHCSDIFHCLQMIYLNCFCCIFKYKNDSDYINSVLEGFQNNCETAEKLGYKKIMYATYPYISQLLRLFIDYFININNEMDFSNTIQNCLKIIIYLTEKLYITQQISKCDNCSVKTGLHDALRLTFLAKNIINISIEKNLDIKMIFQNYFDIVLKQYAILNQLKKLNCSNYERCLKKLQADVHNTAIYLNKAKFYEYSIKMFNIYVKTELFNVKSAEFTNISRAFYNKSISELDCMLFDEAIKGAYLSLVFSGDGLHEKYMSLVMDIKAKALKNDGNEAIQILTVLSVCKDLSEKKDYVNLKPFFSKLKFSVLLKHEFSMYVKLWPSIVPIAGVWMSLNELTKNLHTSWLKGENEEDLLCILYEIMMETPNAVRTIHSDYYKNIVAEMLQRIQQKPTKKIEERIIQANLLFLKSEYDISEATEKYGWKQIDATSNPEQIKNLRTLPQEQPALKHAVEAVELWTEILPKLNTANPTLQHSLRIAEVFVQQLLYTQRVQQGLQLAHVCCELARRLGDKKAYICNVGVILQYVNKPLDRVEQMVTNAIKYWQELISSKQHLEAMLVFACDLAMYYDRCGSCTSDKLLQFVQARILEEEVNYLAVGRLLEAHAQISDTPDTLTRVSAPLRHYVTVTNNETTWVSRRYRSLLLRTYTCGGALCAGRGGRALALWRRARTALCAALRPASAIITADIYTVYIDTNAVDAEVNIDRIKHILGLQPTNEIQPHTIHKEEQHTPKHTQIETMLKSTTFRRLQTSPSSPLVTSSFTMPEFLKHNKICQCYACQVPYSFLIATRTCLLEASMYYRSNDFHIARNYFDGATEALKLAKEKLLNSVELKCEKYISEIIKNYWNKEVGLIEAEILIEESYMELSQNDFTNINNKLIRLDEITKEIKIDLYLQTEINNLLIATSRLKNAIQKQQEDALEIEMEHLSLNPNTELIKTPESKKIPLKGTNKIVKQNELPSLNYKISKLNLDGENYDEKEPIKEVKKSKFKIPEPVISRPILETLTPGPKTRIKAETTNQLAKTRVKVETTPVPKTKVKPDMTPSLKSDLETTATFPKTTQKFETTTPLPTRVKILLTQASQDQGTPVSKTEEFFTPSSTPSEQFFTPMSSVKTYTRKRTAIVKNLENVFSTTQVDIEKENKTGVRTRRAVSSRLNPR
ncbi:PREDICTED: uncharacterized protein LOC106107659 isoform X2 [Papilio polytes]|uniref:uncharacterized protein LOC106107659 isoform X2 n=1 Tax=Papilio polytes TaxID=76194 RepID=UPI0006763981|nr:PREDICTED: uncharacterized protein LOC106107659 isoform X2 [Papilio polytes]